MKYKLFFQHKSNSTYNAFLMPNDDWGLLEGRILKMSLVQAMREYNHYTNKYPTYTYKIMVVE